MVSKRQSAAVQLQKTPNVVAMAADTECHPEIACPVLDRVELFAKRWSMQILKLLYVGDKSFVELERGLKTVAPGMLSKRLKELEAAHIITRKVLSTRPLAVAYHLTDASLKSFACWTTH